MLIAPKNKKIHLVSALSLIFFVAYSAKGACEISVSPEGNVTSVQKAVDMVPENNKERCTIRIAPGTYREQIRIPANKPFISFIGENAETTKITFNISNKQAGSTSAAFAVYIGGHDFYAENITFENSFGQGSQAVALLVEADRSVFNKCRFLGWQDTLYAKNGRQYYKDSYIEGHVDFIFGQAAAVFENCTIHSKGDGYISAPMRFSENENSGLIFIGCRLTSENTSKGVYLGRPWRDYGRSVFINTQMDADIRPEGWHHWQPNRERTAFLAEHNSKGKGSGKSTRAVWSKQLSEDESRAFQANVFLRGTDGWIPRTRPNDDWIKKIRPDFKLVSWQDILDRPAEWYAVDEATRIANQVILYQRSNGGWPKNIDMALMLTQKERKDLAESKNLTDTTVDNGATTTQLAFLAKMVTAKNNAEHKDAFFKGLDYLFSMPYENGGFPQFYPLKNDYSRYITFNDNAMTHVLRLMRDIAKKDANYTFVDDERRKRANEAFLRGKDLILKLQVSINREKTIWSGQYDPVTLLPAPARSFEPVSLSTSESVDIVRFLMLESKPNKETRQAINAAVAWFDENKINGLRWIQDGKNNRIEKDAAAGPIWARFYQIETMRPIFIGRDGIIKYDVSEIESERRNGYAWYIDNAQRLLTIDYPRWKEKVGEK